MDMDCLRTFAAIAMLGNFAKAADRVGRSVSAVSLQINRLEQQVGVRLFRKQGRRMVLSVAGEELLGYARSILAANDTALAAVAESDFAGAIRLGAVQDLAEDILPQILADFSERFPRTRIEMLVERSRLLLEALEANRLDQAIAYKHDTPLMSERLCFRPMVWVGRRGSDLAKQRPLPLVLIEGPCAFRDATLSALGEAGIPWQVTLTSPSLACLASAVEAGLGVTARTPEMLGSRWPGLVEIDELPKLPEVELRLYRKSEGSNPASDELRRHFENRLRRL